MSKEGARPQLVKMNAAMPLSHNLESRLEPHACSWPSLPRVGLDRIPGAESQIRQRAEHLSARQYVRRAGLGENLLGRSDIQQVTNAVVVGFKSSGIGLGGGVQQRRSGLALAKGRVQIRIRGPNLVFDPIARSADLRLWAPRISASACASRLFRAPPSNTVQFRLNATPPVKSDVCPQGRVCCWTYSD